LISLSGGSCKTNPRKRNYENKEPADHQGKRNEMASSFKENIKVKYKIKRIARNDPRMTNIKSIIIIRLNIQNYSNAFQHKEHRFICFTGIKIFTCRHHFSSSLLLLFRFTNLVVVCDCTTMIPVSTMLLVVVAVVARVVSKPMVVHSSSLRRVVV
jgi:hypothetical protein